MGSRSGRGWPILRWGHVQAVADQSCGEVTSRAWIYRALGGPSPLGSAHFTYHATVVFLAEVERQKTSPPDKNRATNLFLV
ncbi:hypothetical protein RRG08_038758 [Elysia crispata]|uniref:Uncharacterized protein n=1 Tax=Elysia crispata TaxID=231223 RepID=A0AAE1AMT9_9GAST|nr:hypothetical protein RRG08_038758 [Elysia crispata]